MRLIHALIWYDALAARVPLSQWKPDVETEGCDKRACAYVAGKVCKHRDPDQVKEGVTFLKSFYNPKVSDPMSMVALKADIDRLLAKLPSRVQDLFCLMYLQGGRFEFDQAGVRQWKSHNKSMDEARKILRIRTMTDVARCHDLHLRRMELTLVDWFPGASHQAAA